MTPVGGRLRNSAAVLSDLPPMPGVAPELSGTPAPGCRASVRRAGLNSSVILAMQPVEGAVALTQTPLATAVADRAQLSKADANGRSLRLAGSAEVTEDG